MATRSSIRGAPDLLRSLACSESRSKQLAAIDHEHFPAYQTQLVADQNYLTKQLSYFLGTARHKVRDRREVRMTICRHRHE